MATLKTGWFARRESRRHLRENRESRALQRYSANQSQADPDWGPVALRARSRRSSECAGEAGDRRRSRSCRPIETGLRLPPFPPAARRPSIPEVIVQLSSPEADSNSPRTVVI